MERIRGIIQKKPLLFFLASLLYIVVIGLLRWGISPPLEAVWFVIGGVIGVYFLDIAEVAFDVYPSPFRSIVFAVLFAAVSLFVITSATTTLAQGLVLSLYLTMTLWQIGELKVVGHLNSWYRMVTGPVDIKTQRWILVAFVSMFLVETFLFIK